MKTFEGLLDGVVFPTQLSAHVVEPADDPRIHGYAVQRELGHSVGFADVIWLSLCGELPNDVEREAFSRALTWLAPLHVADGSVHAGVLAKVAGAPEEVLPSIAALALAQRTMAELQALEPVFAWLAQRSAPLPEVAQGATSAEGWLQLCDDAKRWFGERSPFNPWLVWKRDAAAWALLRLLGFEDRARLISFGVLARLPVALAEAACTASGSVMKYPTQTPAFRYVEEVRS